LSYLTYVGIQYWQKIILIRNQYIGQHGGGVGSEAVVAAEWWQRSNGSAAMTAWRWWPCGGSAAAGSVAAVSAALRPWQHDGLGQLGGCGGSFEASQHQRRQQSGGNCAAAACRRVGNKDTGGNSNGGGTTNNQQSTKSGSGNGDGNDDNNDL
jgi:hypothetical protein